MSAPQPWMKFYPQDWRADEKLRLCSLAARGLWVEMLAIMHRSERYGQLLINGNVPTDAQLAVQVGALPHEVSALLAELESAGVFSRAASGAIYSRRMTRDNRKAQIAKKNGKQGGNPSLRKQTENTPSDNQQDKAGDKLRGQRLDSVSIETGEAPSLAKLVFDRGLGLLKAAGKADKEARSLLGKWRKTSSDATILAALEDCERFHISEPVSWITARLNAKPKTFLDVLQERSAA